MYFITKQYEHIQNNLSNVVKDISLALLTWGNKKSAHLGSRGNLVELRWAFFTFLIYGLFSFIPSYSVLLPFLPIKKMANVSSFRTSHLLISRALDQTTRVYTWSSKAGIFCSRTNKSKTLNGFFR